MGSIPTGSTFLDLDYVLCHSFMEPSMNKSQKKRCKVRARERRLRNKGPRRTWKDALKEVAQNYPQVLEPPKSFIERYVMSVFSEP